MNFRFTRAHFVPVNSQSAIDVAPIYFSFLQLRSR